MTIPELVAWLSDPENKPYEDEDDEGNLTWYGNVGAFVDHVWLLTEALSSKAAMAKPVRDWWVYYTALTTCVLMLEDRNSGDLGIVRNPSRAEWAKAYHAPSHPYRWTEPDRVEIDIPIKEPT